MPLTGALARRHRARAEADGRDGAGAAVVRPSTDAARASPGPAAYGTWPAAPEAVTRARAVELGPHGVRVDAVAPGPVRRGWVSDALVAQATGDIPLRRVGEPADVADDVVILAPAQARWETG
ncbi:SDR family oxidoreductase [Streptomyces sp. NPDC057702]|uniref:SDR family oxidoreductase n=1 Tax=unclassified Streptomyces TaxID=2593676 RepID=UPI0036CCDBB8